MHFCVNCNQPHYLRTRSVWFVVVKRYLRSLLGCSPYGAVVRRQLVEGTAMKNSNLTYLWKVHRKGSSLQASTFLFLVGILLPVLVTIRLPCKEGCWYVGASLGLLCSGSKVNRDRLFTSAGSRQLR